jgi:hypothetical protein
MATYTTSRGRTYEFSFERLSDNSIRPYIVRQPSYGSRDASATATHRLQDSATGRPYICWTNKFTNVQEAAKVAAGWAARTDIYIDTGLWKR